MAEVDSLELKVESNAKSAADGLSELSRQLKDIGKILGGKELSNPLSSTSKGIQNVAKSLNASGNTITGFYKKYKNLGKDWNFFGDRQAMNKQMASLKNQLQSATMKIKEMQASGTNKGKMFEYAVRDAVKYRNQLDVLSKKLKEMDATEKTRLEEEKKRFLASGKSSSELYPWLHTDKTYTGQKEYEEQQARIAEGRKKFLASGATVEPNFYKFSDSVQQLREMTGYATKSAAEVKSVQQAVASVNAETTSMGSSWKSAFGLIGRSVKNVGINTGVVGYSQEYQELLNEMKTLESEALRLQQRLTEVQASGKSGNYLAKKIDSVNAKLKETQDRLAHIAQDGGGKLNFTLFSNIGNGIKNYATKAKDAIGSSRLLNKTIGGLGSSLGGLHKSSHKARKGLNALDITNTKLAKSFFRVGKMLKLMFVRTALRSFVTGTQQGFKNLIGYSDQFNASISLMWNSMRQLANAFAAATAPVINAFAPAIDFVIQKVIDAINVINQLVSTLLGNTTWIKASKLTDSYRDSLDKASGSAKALKKQLQGFDELNNLTTNSGGSGGSSNTPNYNDMFTTEELGSEWQSIIDRFKESWDMGDFEWLGEDISTSIGNQLEKINWDKIQGNAKRLASSLATFLNGLFNVETFGTVGTTIAESLNTAIIFAFEFGNKFDFKNAGQAIANSINKFFDEFDFALLAESLNRWATGLREGVVEAISNIDWGDVVSGLFDFLGALDVSTVLTIVGLKVLFSSSAKASLVSAVGGMVTGSVQNAALASGTSIGTAVLGGITAAFIGWNIGQWLYDNNILGLGDVMDNLVEDVAGVVEEIKSRLSGVVEDSIEEGTSFSDNIFWNSFAVLGNGMINLAGGDADYSGEEYQQAGNEFLKDLTSTTGKIFKWMTNGSFESGKLLGEKYMNFIHSTSSSYTFGNKINAGELIKPQVNVELVTTEKDIENWNATIQRFWVEKGHPLPASSKYITTSSDVGQWTKTTENYWVKPNLTANSKYTTTSADINQWTKTTENNWRKPSLTANATFSTNSANVSGWSNNVTAWWKKPNLTSNAVEPFNSSLMSQWNRDVVNQWNKNKPSLTSNATLNTSIKLDQKGKDMLSRFGFNVTGYATGGFPEDGWFRTSHGEFMGQFDDGTSVVANNQQIIAGINLGVASGMRDANAESNALLRQQNDLLLAILNKETGLTSDDVFNAVKSKAQSEYNRTGSNALVF